MHRSFARGLVRFLKSEDGTLELEWILSRFDFVVWAPAVVAALCTPLVYLAAQVGRRHRLPAPPDGGRSERRSSLRSGGTHPSVLLSDAEVEARLVRGTVIDRSSTGLAIAVDELVRPGEVLSVRVAANYQEMPWVQVMVRNFRREGSYFLLGCQFLCPQPWDILMLFG